MVPPPWRGAGRFVAWLSTSVSNYSKAGSCLWAAAPVPGVLMMSFFFRILLSTDLEAGVTVRSVRHLNHYWRCFLIPVGWAPGISDGRKRTGSSSVLFHSRSAGTDQRCSRSWLSRFQDICKYVPTCFSTEVDAFVLTKRFGFGRADTTLAGGGDVNGRPHTHSHSLTFTHSLTHLPHLPHHLPHLPHSLTHSPTHSLHFTSLHSLHSLSHPSLTHTTLTSLTHTLTHSLYMNIHTYTQTHPPSPLHHSYTSSSLLAFLWSV